MLQLMRIYGALMWSLGKVLNVPEVMRVYIGSFNDKSVHDSISGPLGNELFRKEQDDLLSDSKDIPKKACDRKVSFIRTFSTNSYVLVIVKHYFYEKILTNSLFTN
ncbi:hypothetical protein ACSQ67_015818 [Phaseolus vulgaris]